MNMYPITITSKARKKGKLDIKEFQAQIVTLDTQHFFILDKSTRAIQRMRFQLEPGCSISFDGHTFVCENIAYTTTPKRPIISAYQVA